MLLLLSILLQDAAGPHVPLTEEGAREIRSLGSSDNLVAAYYFYRRFGDTPEGHRRQLEEMKSIGIDIVLVAPSSLDGLGKLAEGLEEVPKIGLFLDAADLAADAASLAIRNFYSVVPPRLWAAIDGRPLLWLSAAGKEREGSAFGRVSDRLREDFRGRTPFLVADESWSEISADRRFAWGASRTGPRDVDVIAVGPGADPTSYTRAWYVALKTHPKMIAIESWNGFPEGSEIYETKEHGRNKLTMTRQYIEKYRRKEVIPNPRGKWTGQKRVGYNLKYNPHDLGLVPVPNDDGLYAIVATPGLEMLTTKKNALGDRRCLYFTVDDSFSFWERRSFEVQVEYLDVGSGAFGLEYDSADPSKVGKERRYKSAGEREFGGNGDWKVAHFALPDAYFANRQKGGADFRLTVRGRGLTIRWILVRPK